MTTADDLVRFGKLRREAAAARLAPGQLEQARRSLEAGRAMAGVSSEWLLTIAYTAALQAIRALMFSQGLRPVRGEGEHVVTMQFGKLALVGLSGSDANFLEQLRTERHRAVYGAGGNVTADHAAAALELADRVVALVAVAVKG